MGQKRAWKRQHLLFCIAGCLMFALWPLGCAYLPERWKTEEHLAKADYYLSRGYFSESLRESRAVLNLYPQLLGDQALFHIGLIYSHPENPEHDYTKAREAFGALVYKYPDSTLKPQAEMWITVLRNMQDIERLLGTKNRELGQLREQLKDLQEDAKKLQDQNKKIVDAKDRQIKELEENIDKLKEVDLKIEEKKRKSSP